ncbi:MAG: acyltransferase family protein [Prevotella sp.]|jgi:fucose 4-O-acetylase-like acetyltransferase|nr:acyltransferase family protein [Prevotella sp.]
MPNILTVQNERVSKRKVWVDWAKALCIFCVVIGHEGTLHMTSFVYAFHVPAFFVISGYLYKPTDWKKTFLSFSIPVVFFSIVVFLFKLIAFHFNIDETWKSTTWFVWKLDSSRPLFTGLWFLEVLFVGRLLLGDLNIHFFRNHYKSISFICILASMLIDYFHVELSWYISRLLECFPFLGLGLFLKDHDLISKIRKKVVPIMGGVFLLLIWYNGHCDIMYNRYNRTYFLFFINAVLGTLLLFYFCKMMKKNKFIEMCSIGTLVILGTHRIILGICNHLLPWSLSQVISPPLAMIVAFYIIIFTYKYCPVLLGKVRFLGRNKRGSVKD